VAGRLLPTAPGTQPPTTSATTTPVSTASPATFQAVRVPDAVGQPLAQATAAMREAGLQGAPSPGDPQGPTAVVVAQGPAAGELVDPGSMIGFRTSADIVPNGTARRVRLGPGLGPDQGAAVYLVRAPDPARHELTVVVAMPGPADVEVRLEPGPGQRPLVVLSGVWDAAACPLTGGQIRCVVRFGTLEVAAPGVWIASVAKRSPVPAEVTVTVTFRPR
jgi:hypothetical protein